MHVLVETLHVRRRIAELLAYPSWAHYAMEVRMAGGPAAVERFYDDLVPRVRDAGRGRDRGDARGAAGRDRRRRAAPVGRPLPRHAASPNEVRHRSRAGRRVFPAGPRLGGPVRDHRRRLRARLPRGRRTPRAWHPDVRLYEIHDRASGELLAWAYADLFPREGKFTHAAAFPLVVAHRSARRRRATIPVSAIVANFTPPAAGKPALLRHEEVDDAVPRVRPHPAHVALAGRVRALLGRRDRVATSSRRRPRSWSTGRGTPTCCGDSRATTRRASRSRPSSSSSSSRRATSTSAIEDAAPGVLRGARSRLPRRGGAARRRGHQPRCVRA